MVLREGNIYYLGFTEKNLPSLVLDPGMEKF